MVTPKMVADAATLTFGKSIMTFAEALVASAVGVVHLGDKLVTAAMEKTAPINPPRR